MVKLGWKDKMPFPGQCRRQGMMPCLYQLPRPVPLLLLPSGSWRPRLQACVVPSTPVMAQGHVPQEYEMTAPGPCGGGVDGEVRAM